MNDRIDSLDKNIGQERIMVDLLPKPLQPLERYQDDITALAAAFNMPELSYVDLSLEYAYQQALTNWPLLAELYQD